MFPNADGSYILCLQGGVRLAVTDAIAGQLWLPIGAVVLWHDEVSGAFVEEAAIGKQRKPEAG